MHLIVSILLAAFTVVIDAGHGGKDPGAIGLYSQEKDLNLDAALRLGRKIEANYAPEDVRVVYTRSTDVYLTLQERANIVNKNNADLFICIHTNSAENRKVSGAETFVLGTEKMDKNLDVAMRENSVIKLEKDYKTTYHGFDPNSIDSYIMFELMQNNYMDQSLRYATYVQRHFSDTLKRADRGVRQAAFWVLLKSACPSVLVEMGFISNADEEHYLMSEKGKEEIVDAMYKSFVSFCKRQMKPTELTVVESTETVESGDSVGNSVSTEVVVETVRPKWAVQILATKEPLKKGDKRLKGVTDYGVVERGGYYKYYVSPVHTRAEVSAKVKEWRTIFSDCFPVEINKE